jgi:hypothetical protein
MRRVPSSESRATTPKVKLWGERNKKARSLGPAQGKRRERPSRPAMGGKGAMDGQLRAEKGTRNLLTQDPQAGPEKRNGERAFKRPAAEISPDACRGGGCSRIVTSAWAMTLPLPAGRTYAPTTHGLSARNTALFGEIYAFTACEGGTLQPPARIRNQSIRETLKPGCTTEE